MRYFRYHSTNCFFLPCSSSRYLAFDAGWPCTLQEYNRMMKTIGLRLSNLAGIIVSHMHMDHAGLLGEFQNLGFKCFLLDQQFDGIDTMEKIILKNQEYRDYCPIDKQGIIKGSLEELNQFCWALGTEGRAISTPGHSPDSISFLTVQGEALIGDLYPKHQLIPEDTLSRESWALLERLGATTAYPSHAAIFAIDKTD